MKQRFNVPQEAPFGTGGFETIQSRRPARRGVYGLLAVAAVAIVAMVYWYNSNIKPGRIELAVTPGDATVLIDNIKVGDHSPVSVEKSPDPTRCRSRATVMRATIRTSSSRRDSRWR